MAIRGSGSCTLLTLTPSIHVKRGIATFATLTPPRNDSTVNWDDATSGFFEKDSRPIMLFDGVCNLCNGGVRFVRDNDRNRRIRYEALQSKAGRKLLRRSGRAPDDISSVVLVERDRFLRDFVYDNVANNRYTIFGRSESCEIYYD